MTRADIQQVIKRDHGRLKVEITKIITQLQNPSNTADPTHRLFREV